MTHPWPLFDLRVRTARLELRLPSDEDLLSLLDVAHAGIHDPDTMPFGFAWTDLQGLEFDLGFLKFFWGARASWTPSAWQLPLAVILRDQPIGIQEVRASGFLERRTVETGSWLGSTWQRQGFGTEMRAAVLHLSFQGLGAMAAISAALEGNEASRRVSEKLGYRPNGIGLVAPRGHAVKQDRYLLSREDWRPDQWSVQIAHLETCRGMFGLSPSTGAAAE